MDTVDMNRYRLERVNPSFSSTLLDVIYRSIDERDDENSVVYRETMRKRQSIDGCFHVDQKNIGRVRRDCLSEKWTEKKTSEKVVVRRKSTADFESSSQRSEGDSFYFSSSIGSSYSSIGGGFSSSEVECIYGFPARPKPIRTSTNEHHEHNTRERKSSKGGRNYEPDDLQNPKSEGKFGKTKSRALKIYGDLKKAKQPISPGGRLATLLNSLFTPGNAKKSKNSSSCTGGHDAAIIHTSRKSKSVNASSCSSASSYTRSCLSQSPSLKGKLNTGMRRSVRFYPASVIVDENCHPRAYKTLNGDGSDSPRVKFARNSINKEPKVHFTEKDRHIKEAAKKLLKNYQKEVERVLDLIKNKVTCDGDIAIETINEEDDDDASYASSDLFELDNLSAIGMDRHIDELPLYETTRIEAIEQ